MKKFITGLVTGAILASSIVLAASYTADPASFKVLVNGKEFISDPPAMVINGSTYLPLRAMGNALGVPVNWNEELKQAEVGNQAPVAEENQYSRNNPAPLNTVQTYTRTSDYLEEYNYTAGIRVLEIIRGDKAFKALKAKSAAYEEPQDGYEYVNAKIAFSAIKTKSDFSIEPSQGDFKAFTSNNEECPYNMWSSIEPILTGNLYEGGNTEGWITVMVKKDDANPKLAYGLDYNGQNGIWFALYE